MKTAPALAAAALVLSLAHDASAYCVRTTCNDDDCERDDRKCKTTGEPLRWRSLPIHFRFTRRDPATLLREEARAAVRSAFYRWSDTLCGGQRTSLRFVEDSELDEDKPLEPESRASQPYGIFFRDTGWPYEGKADKTLAQANTRFTPAGLIGYSDIEVNTGQQNFAVNEDAPPEAIDLQAVLTHEVGHYIGLDHSVEDDSIMAESYCEREATRCKLGRVAARRLAEDDIDAVCALYPPSGYEAPEDPDGGCSTAPAAPPPFWPFALVALALLRFAKRRAL